MEILKSLDPCYEEYGTEHYKYKLEPPVTEEEVIEFETFFKIKLPEDYRNFIINIGNGGAGPSNGLYGLWNIVGEIRYFRTRDEELSMEFPFSEQWSLGDPIPEKSINIKSPTQGTIPICHHGCGMLTYLVVTGPERGNLWGFPSEELYPMVGKDGKRLKFAEWYMDWLDGQIARLSKKRGMTLSGEINWELRWICPNCGYTNLNQYMNCFHCYYEKKK